MKKMTDMVYSLLEETPPDGEKFAKIVKHILMREEHWNTWKNDGCPGSLFFLKYFSVDFFLKGIF